MKGTIIIGVMFLTAPAWAQAPGVSQGATTETERAVERERRVLHMEQLLEEAVTRGVRVVEQQLPAVATQLLFFAGPVQARGFMIDGYGIFFDVEYPVVRRSLLWSMNALDGLDGGMSAALRDLRARMSALPEGPGQAALQAIAEMEAQLQGTLRQPAVGRPPLRTASDADATSQAERTVVDPRDAYLSALQGELASAIVAFGSALDVGADEWLSVAARDGRGRVDPRVTGPRRTLQLRISGRDLEALREGRLSPEEARQRVQ